ncbi:MAG TPA: CoA transferase [Ramlibacter sp.]|nr:CoA transferase [Ramlibacter sp.]
MTDTFTGGATADGPLAGHRVLELGSTASGPFATRVLADFGADVVKVEATEGDPIRALSDEVDGKSLYAATICRNKRIVSLDLRLPEAQQLVRRMVPKFDVVVENFRPGTLERWGLGWDDLRALRPDLVMTRISGYGQTGPYAGKPGYGVIAEAMSGLRHLIGDPDRPPSRVAMPLTDYVTGLYAVIGTLMAVQARERTGQGQFVDVSLLESAFSFMDVHVPVFDKTGKSGMRSGARLPRSAPNTLFPTRDGEHVHVAALADAVFRRLAKVMGQPQLATDPRFATQAARNANEAAIEAIVAEWTSQRTVAEVLQALDANDVPATRIFTMQDIFADPHFRARDMLVRAPDDDLGEVTLGGVVPKLSATPGRIRWSGRRIGQDTREVLREFAGLADSEIDALQHRGVVACDPQQAAREAAATTF